MKHIYRIAILGLFLLFTTLSYGQSSARNNDKKEQHQSQLEYQTETYHYTHSKKSESELKNQIGTLKGIHDVQIDPNNSTIIIKFDAKKNTKGKLNKSFKKIGLSGKFADVKKTDKPNKNNSQKEKDKQSEKEQPKNDNKQDYNRNGKK